MTMWFVSLPLPLSFSSFIFFAILTFVKSIRKQHKKCSEIHFKLNVVPIWIFSKFWYYQANESKQVYGHKLKHCLYSFFQFFFFSPIFIQISRSIDRIDFVIVKSQRLREQTLLCFVFVVLLVICW